MALKSKSQKPYSKAEEEQIENSESEASNSSDEMEVDEAEDESSEESEDVSLGENEEESSDEDEENSGEEEEGNSEEESHMQDEEDEEVSEKEGDDESEEDDDESEEDDEELSNSPKKEVTPPNKPVTKGFNKGSGISLYIRFPYKLPADDETLEKSVKELCSRIIAVRRTPKKDVHSCLADFENKEDCIKALKELRSVEINGQNLFVKFSSFNKEDLGPRYLKLTPLLVKNIPSEVKMSDIKGLFPKAVKIMVFTNDDETVETLEAVLKFVNKEDAVDACEKKYELGGNELTAIIQNNKLPKKSNQVMQKTRVINNRNSNFRNNSFNRRPLHFQIRQNFNYTNNFRRSLQNANYNAPGMKYTNTNKQNQSNSENYKNRNELNNGNGLEDKKVLTNKKDLKNEKSNKKEKVKKVKQIKEGEVKKEKKSKEGEVKKVKKSKEGEVKKEKKSKEGEVKKVKKSKDGEVKKEKQIKEGKVKKVKPIKEGKVTKAKKVQQGVQFKKENGENISFKFGKTKAK